MTTTTPNTDPQQLALFGDERDCVARLAPAWQRADLHQNYPATTADVATVLRDGMGYDITAATLANWVQGGMVLVKVWKRELSWTAANIVHAAMHCEQFRRFLPLHPLHVKKLSAAELLQARAERDGRTAFHDVELVATRDLVAMLACADDPESRHLLAVGLLAKLKALGVADR